jgi:hypothetical protein
MSTSEPFSIRQWLAGLPAGSIGWVFLVSGVLFLVGGAYQTITGLAHDRSLEQEGRSVDGTVLEKKVGTRMVESQSHEGRTRQTYYSVAYRFSVLGEDITDTVELDKDVWDQLREQGPIRVTYLPDEPGRHRVEGQEAEFQIWKLLLSLAGAGLMFYVGKLLLAGKLQLSSSSESED